MVPPPDRPEWIYRHGAQILIGFLFAQWALGVSELGALGTLLFAGMLLLASMVRTVQLQLAWLTYQYLQDTAARRSG